MVDPRHVADTKRLRRSDDPRIGGEIFVVGERGPRGQDVVLGEPLELGFVGELALWKYVTAGVVIDGAVVRAA
jgi:hypothetical protein